MKDYKLGDVIINYDSLRVPLSQNERKKIPGPFRYYGAQEIVDYINDYIYDGEYLLVAEDGNNLVSRKKPLCTLVEGKFWVNNHAHIIQANEKSDTRYLYYLLNNINIRGYVTGSAQPKLNQENLNKIKIKLPTLEEQKNISDKLQLFDKKIKMNIDTIKILEEYLQLLFRKWFIEFNFYDEFDEPYKDSGREMKEVNGKLIPKNWETLRFDDLFTFEKGTIPESVFKKNDGSKYPYLTIEFLEEGKGEFAEKSTKLLEVNDLDVLMVMDGARSGKIFTAIDGYLGSTLAKIVPKDEVYRDLGFMFLKMRESAISRRTTGSTVPHTSKNYVNSLMISLPESTIELEAFTSQIHDLRQKISILQKENLLLSEARDLLIYKYI